MNSKINILYERLSHEDGRENESLSIENQKVYLEEYATRNGFTNLVRRLMTVGAERDGTDPLRAKLRAPKNISIQASVQYTF